MKQIDVIEVYDRGLSQFDSLSHAERDFFVIHHLDLWYEMEGSFEDFFLGESYKPQIQWLADTLQRIGDHPSLAILVELRRLTWDQRETLASLSDSFYEIRESRWQLLEHYLHQRELAIAW